MAPLRTAAALASAASALLPLLPPPAAAQSGGGNTKVWAAVAYVYNGEVTPGPEAVLTPVGAQQLLRQGAAFRRRYLAAGGSSNSSSSSNSSATAAAADDDDDDGAAHIQGLAADAMDNRKLTVLTTADAWAASGAAAFLQGLYPPREGAFIDPTGANTLGNDFTADGNATEYPLRGYQYPLIRTQSSGDEASVR